MSERYTKLFSLPADLYATGSPVVVSAGNLLKDNETGRVLVQLKIKNVSFKTVKAATVIVHALDTAGLPLDGDAEKEYLDFSAAPGAEFGQKVAVPLPRDTTRGFTAAVSKAVFADNSVWTGADAPWEPLPPVAKINDPELSKQLQLTFGGPCEYLPQEHKDLWRCACGAWNKGETCYACGKKQAAMLSLDLAALNEEKNERVAQEKAAREVREAADRAAAEAQAKKTKKLLSILLPVAAVCLAAILLVTKVVVPNSNYKKAKALMDGGQYEEAIAAFEALDGYKDSEAQIDRCQNAILGQKYTAAVALLDDGRLSEAMDAFVQIREYADSEDKLLIAADKMLSGCHLEYTLPMSQSWDNTYETTYVQEDHSLSLFSNNRFEASYLTHFKTVGKKGYAYFNSEFDSMSLWSGTYRLLSIDKDTNELKLQFDIKSTEDIMYYGTSEADSRATDYLYYEAVVTLNKEGKPEQFVFDNYGSYPPKN